MTVAAFPDRRVRRLALTAPSAEQARHSAVVLADALHTATLPAAGQGRLVVIRRLALGRIDPAAGGASLALRIEQVAHALISQAVPADSPQAPTASAVWFRDTAQALVLLARRVALNQESREWFWSAAFPAGLLPQRSGPAAWRAILDLAHDQPAPLPTVAAVVREAVRTGVGVEILAAVSPVGLRQWLWRLGLDPSVTTAPGAARELPPPPALFKPVLDTALVTWGADDPRTFWFTAITLFAGHASIAATAAFGSMVRARLTSWAEAAAVRSKSDTPPAKTSHRDPAAPIDRAEKQAPGEVAVRNATRQTREAPGADRSDQEPLAASPPDHTPAGEWSRYAGLLCVVPILTRLGIGEFLELNPVLADTGFAHRLLLWFGQRVGLPESDPLSSVLTDEAGECAEPASFRLPPLLTRLVLESSPRRAIVSARHAWLHAVRHWIRPNGRMGLVTLIRRRGLVLASRAHLDICFSLDQADVRLRRQALDVDPGWVPWLGRVVRFHYGDGNHGF
jgi:hypothetical protein